MFQENELVIYGNNGVCRVKAVGTLKDIDYVPRDRMYYTLEPVYEKGTIYAPVDTKVFMRPVLTRTQASALIEKIPTLKRDDMDLVRNQKTLLDTYEASIGSHRCEDLVQLIDMIRRRNERAAQNGKKPALTDERYLKKARMLLHGELAAALEIPIDDVEQYIQSVLQANIGESPAI